MNKIAVIQGILRDFFDDENIEINEDTSAKDIYGWDSLANIQIMLSIEIAFGTEFSMDELASFKCIKDIIENLNSKKL